jgi:hypothetical protein
VTVFARPGVLASTLAAAAAALHPGIGASRWLPARPAVLAALLLLAALGLLARAVSTRGRPAHAALTAAGATVLLVALGVDGLRGRHGTMSLAPGQVRPHFDETGLDGRSLGLRPLGFTVGAERVDAGGGIALALPGRRAPVALTAGRALSFGGYRLAGRGVASTGGASRLRIAASDAKRTLVADVAPGAPGRASDLTILLDRYFPDFALDDRQQPFSRSPEPRNPAALLTVQRGASSHRAFVLQSMPGIHRVEALGLAFSLLEVEPERTVEIAVHREPAALAALVGSLVLALGVALSLSSPLAPPPGGDGAVPLLTGGGVLAGLLLLVDRGAVLAWGFGLPGAEGRVPLAGVGVAFGIAFIAALGGSLLLAASRLAGGVAGTRPAARSALWIAVLAAVAGLLLALVQSASLPLGRTAAASLPLAGVALAAVLLAVSLLASQASPPALASRAAGLAVPLAAVAALALAIGAGVSGVLHEGTYAGPATAATAAAFLLGRAALEPTRVPGARRFAFLLVLLALAAG